MNPEQTPRQAVIRVASNRASNQSDAYSRNGLRMAPIWRWTCGRCRLFVGVISYASRPCSGRAIVVW